MNLKIIKRKMLVVLMPLIPKKFFIAFWSLLKTKNLPSFSKPITFNDKIHSRKLNSESSFLSVMSDYSDKVKIRDLIRHTKSDILMPKLFGVYDNTSQIALDLLPSSFVIKTNHDSGSVFIVRDKNNFDFKSCFKAIDESMNVDYGAISHQPHYSLIERKIFCEELLLDTNGDVPSDIKIHCFHGQPEFIQVADSDHKSNNIYNTDWELLNVDYLNVRRAHLDDKPFNLSEILNLSGKLSSKFDYVRIDLYILNEKIYLGEFTFTPNNGFAKISPNHFNYEWGNMW